MNGRPELARLIIRYLEQAGLSPDAAQQVGTNLALTAHYAEHGWHQVELSADLYYRERVLTCAWSLESHLINPNEDGQPT